MARGGLNNLVSLGLILYRGGEAFAVEQIELARAVAADFAKHRYVAGDHRAADSRDIIAQASPASPLAYAMTRGYARA
jgi:hypothetical protein